MNKYALTKEEDIVKQIEQADELQLNAYIHAIIRRHQMLRTDRELSFLSLPTDPETRNAELENIFEFIRTCYKKQDAQQKP